MGSGVPFTQPQNFYLLDLRSSKAIMSSIIQFLWVHLMSIPLALIVGGLLLVAIAALATVVLTKLVKHELEKHKNRDDS